MGSVTKVSPLPSCTHELASEPETAMYGVTDDWKYYAVLPTLLPGLGSSSSVGQPAEGQRTGWGCCLFLRPPLQEEGPEAPERSRVWSRVDNTSIFRLHGIVGCLAYCLLPTALCQETWG